MLQPGEPQSRLGQITWPCTRRKAVIQLVAMRAPNHTSFSPDFWAAILAVSLAIGKGVCRPDRMAARKIASVVVWIASILGTLAVLATGRESLWMRQVAISVVALLLVDALAKTLPLKKALIRLPAADVRRR